MSPVNQNNGNWHTAHGTRQASPNAPCSLPSGESRHAASESQSQSQSQSGPEYWRSLDELADSPEFREFLHDEFPAGATELLDSGDRRHFLRIMAASMALAGVGMSGCRRWPVQHIVPYSNRPDGRMPGVPVQYATTMEIAGVGYGLLATSYDGRPIKIEGNPEHPTTRGRTDAISQASILNLYDPDRSRFPRHNGERKTLEEFRAWMEDRLEPLRGRTSGGRLAILSEATRSPSVLAMRRRLAETYPLSEWHEYEALCNDNELLGSAAAFGHAFRSHYHFDIARVIVSLDSDFLLAHPNAIAHTKDFASMRRADGPQRTMNRLYVCEATHSLTGANADERLAVRSADIGVVAAKIAARVLGGAQANVQQAAAAFEDVNLPEVDAFVDRIVADLEANRGASVITVGRNQPPQVHLLAHMLNEALGNVGETVTYTAEPDDASPHARTLAGLVEEMRGGRVDTLVIIGGNPVYSAPGDVDFANAIAEFKQGGGAVVHLSDYFDETSELADWHVNRAHYLETWSDARAYDGTVSVTQPLIEPLFGGLSPIELLAVMIREETSGHEIVQQTFAGLTGTSAGDRDRVWRRALHDGVVANSAAALVTPRVLWQEAPAHLRTLRESWQNASGDAAQLEVVFIRDQKIHDGRFANNGWLQELPDVMTKVTWDNVLILNPAHAEELGIERGSRGDGYEMVEVRVGDRAVEAAVVLLPGHHRGSASIALGYGRRLRDGRIAEGAGVDAYPLRTTSHLGFATASIRRLGRRYKLAITQDHHAVGSTADSAYGGLRDRLPTIFRETTRQDFIERGGEFAKHPKNLHVAHRLSQWEENFPFHSANDFKGAREANAYAWAMSIDLSTCTGCSACIVACQAENNIPVVGKDQVIQQREMHWIRIDRYFKGRSEERPDSVGFMPMPCQHCENAPCEQVCPVAATVHDKDGLNVMVYNRCIGTRYCSNNCPYKVRRFNYFDFMRRRPLRETGAIHVSPEYYGRAQAAPEPLHQMQMNPEVTIRSRGVMEKCTFCVQRITRARIKAKNEWVRKGEDERRAERPTIPDGEVVPACAQACPADAIVFGDLLDPNSRVSQLHKSERSFQLLEELNTKPRTRYLGKIRNPRT